MRVSSLTALALSCPLVHSATLPSRRATVDPYAPFTTSCSSGSLIRPARELNSDEKAYIEQRRPKASQALSEWLSRAWGGANAKTTELPNLALVMSGGGPKAGLITAGAFYGLDERENSSFAVRGLLQSMNYVSALSGGSLTLDGIMANDFALVSTLKSELYDSSYLNLINIAIANRDQILEDVGSKSTAGYPTSLLDLYGRVLGYNFIAPAPTGGNNLLWSNVTTQSSFQDHDAPYPIVTITQADVAEGMCEPSMSAPIWEISPVEFGSWDDAVDAFYPTRYLGTRDSQAAGKCTSGFDNIGFITGVSSNILINGTYCTTGDYNSSSLASLASIINITFPDVSSTNPYGIIPNPFYQSADAGVVRDQETLYGTDGGDSGQAAPIFPFIQPERDIDVIFIIDATSSQPSNITNGGSIFNTYQSAQMKGLSKMPPVPSVDQFAAGNFSAGAHFYGCRDSSVATLIYMPDTGLNNISSGSFFYTPEQINSTFQGGVNMVTQNDDEEWAGCVACAIMHKTDYSLPESCGKCLDKYCWAPSSDDSGDEPVCVGSYTTDADGVLKEVPCATAAAYATS